MKSVEADKLLALGQIADARASMAEAAALDRAYMVRAELIGQEDARKIRVSTTVRKILIPFLSEVGFAVSDGQRWAEGNFLNRTIGGMQHSILIGRSKFGYQLGLMAAKWQHAHKVQHFDWHIAGLRSGTLAYKTQAELEVVCDRWRDLITRYLYPWFEDF
ncbi:MAG: hypothetical protein JEZ00_09130 [Anaerolineaceae bacterium]|nr:hypothetical protein [Anaerolineaceae bacterium]